MARLGHQPLQHPVRRNFAEPRPRRSVIVGDVHGCSWELEQLIRLIGVGRDDAVFFLGDMLTRGPDPRGVMDIVRGLGARCIRGNHEDRMLASRAARRSHPLLDPVRAVLRRSDWAFLQALPFWIDLPHHGVLLVHAGIVPGVSLTRQRPEHLMTIRYLTRKGQPLDQGGRILWGERYRGRRHVVFGHNATRKLQVHDCATGIDTGCVYGGRLTAMVLLEGERVPAADERESVLLSVPARQIYYRAR